MRKLIIVLIIGAVVLGVIISECNCTVAIVFATIFASEIFKRTNKKTRRTARKI